MFSWILNIVLAFLVLVPGGEAISNRVEVMKPNPSAPELRLEAEKGAVLSANDRSFLYCKNADEAQPIASITKLMTALVFVNTNPNWKDTYTVTEADKVEGGRLNLFTGDTVTLDDLFHTSLVASDNGATLALVHASGLREGEFVSRMNAEAKRMGLKQTKFVDPIGLSDENVSTAREVALLAKAALSRKEIREATALKEYRFITEEGRSKLVESTDYLLFDPGQSAFTVLGGKTGYTDKAGYCFVGRFKDKSGRELISVVLNSQGKNERFRETKSLVNWIFNNFMWRPAAQQ